VCGRHTHSHTDGRVKKIYFRKKNEFFLRIREYVWTEDEEEKVLDDCNSSTFEMFCDENSRGSDDAIGSCQMECNIFNLMSLWKTCHATQRRKYKSRESEITDYFSVNYIICIEGERHKKASECVCVHFTLV